MNRTSTDRSRLVRNSVLANQERFAAARGQVQPHEHPGEAWRDRMRKVGVSQAELARRAGISPKGINQILQGNALPTPETVVKMARSLYGDGAEAKRWANVLYGIQARHEVEKTFEELKDWQPARRGRRVIAEKGE